MSQIKLNKRYLILRENSFLSSHLGQILFFQEEKIQTLTLDFFQQHHFFTDVDTHYFVLESRSEMCLPQLETWGAEWVSLRSQLGKIPDAEFQLIGRAQQIVRWYKEHQYCGQCGTKTQRISQDFAMCCPTCQLEFYPKIAPCIIVLVTRGSECLLAQHARSSSTQRFSCLAGFIEAGETPEQTLVREVMEEVGIKVQNPRYVASQAWPFPGQLMLGFIADYVEGEIRVDKHEIINAQWFSEDQLPEIPPTGTIARELIDYFFNRSF